MGTISKRKTALAAASAFAALMASGVACAQTSAATAPQANEGMEDIVVTAQRRPEKIQNIPVAVTAFTETTIKDLHLKDALSVSKYVPSMISAHNAGHSPLTAS